MQTERAFKYHTQLKSELRSSMSHESVNNRMWIALNSKGTERNTVCVAVL